MTPYPPSPLKIDPNSSSAYYPPIIFHIKQWKIHMIAFLFNFPSENWDMSLKKRLNIIPMKPSLNHVLSSFSNGV